MTTSNSRDDDQEMSMDEILASIRRYVSSDESSTKVDSKPIDSGVKKFAGPDTATNQRVSPRLDIPRLDPNSDVVRLNDTVRDEKKTYGVKDESTSENITKTQSNSANKTFSSPSSSSPEGNTHRPDHLVSDKTLATTMESFARLRDVTAPKTNAKSESAASSHQTLDQLFENLARPMIAEWLERNLPQMVERMVMREIERITKF